MSVADVLFIVTGIVIVAVVGRLLAYAGRRYVAGGGAEGRNVGSIATLVSVVFHLVTLGLLALLAATPLGVGVHGYLIRVGVLFLVVGLAYAIAVGVLSRRREVATKEATMISDAQDGHDPAEPPVPPVEAEPETAVETVVRGTRSR